MKTGGKKTNICKSVQSCDRLASLRLKLFLLQHACIFISFGFFVCSLLFIWDKCRDICFVEEFTKKSNWYGPVKSILPTDDYLGSGQKGVQQSLALLFLEIIWVIYSLRQKDVYNPRKSLVFVDIVPLTAWIFSLSMQPNPLFCLLACAVHLLDNRQSSGWL